MATTTTHMAMQKPADGEYGWSQMIRDNADKVDARLGAEHNADGTHGTVNSPSVVAPSMTLGGVQRNTWPSSGSAAVAIDDVLKNGHISNRDVVLGRYGVSAIDFVLPIPAANIVDHDFFDNTQDAAWIDQCADKSWETEHIASGKQYYPNGVSYANDAAAILANPSMVTGDVYYDGTNFREYNVGTTTRAGSRRFPMRGFVTAEDARVIIWDITSGSPEMWMVFVAGNGWMRGIPSSVSMIYNTLVVGALGGLFTCDFVSERMRREYSTGSFPSVGLLLANISRGKSSVSLIPYDGKQKVIVNNTVNSVAITYLPDAPLDDYGMRVPTIAVGTAGGVSVIKDDESVVNASWLANVGNVSIAGTTMTYGNHVGFLDGFSSISLINIGAAFNGNGFYTNTIPWMLSHFSTSLTDTLHVGWRKVGGPMCLLKENPTTPTSSMVAYLTNTYNTGWMVGDIRRAYLCNSLTADRSVKGGTLTMTGTVTETVNAGGVNVYSGFSAANYLSEASHADWNALGTGDFSIIMSGVKWGTAGTGRVLLQIGDYSSVGACTLEINSANQGKFYIHDGSAWLQICATSAITDSASHHLACVRSGTAVTIYIDGIAAATGNSALSISTALGGMRVGNNWLLSGAWQGGQVAQVRISATAPTPEQIKHMYETERKLFEPNAQALLSNSASVTDLRYDKKSGMYAVTNGTNTDLFKDLVRVDSAATSATIATPVTTLSGNRVLAPAVDVGSELAAQVKPDKHSIIKAIAAVGGIVSLPMGHKPIGCYDVTGAAFVRLTTANTAFDGFIHSVTGLTGTQTYDITMEAV